MSKTTLITNSLILALGSVLLLSIATYLVPINLALSPTIAALLGAALSLILAVIYAIILHKKFGTNTDKKESPQTILVNETWILKH